MRTEYGPTQRLVMDRTWHLPGVYSRYDPLAIRDSRFKTGRKEVVLMVVYDAVREGDDGNGKLDYRVTSFAPFKITPVQDTGSPEKIVGRFQRRYIVAGPQAGPDDDGIVPIQLTR